MGDSSNIKLYKMSVFADTDHDPEHLCDLVVGFYWSGHANGGVKPYVFEEGNRSSGYHLTPLESVSLPSLIPSDFVGLCESLEKKMMSGELNTEQAPSHPRGFYFQHIWNTSGKETDVSFNHEVNLVISSFASYAQQKSKPGANGNEYSP
ncbi:MAG TPA: hypothetical protein ENN46_01785 [Candidatus Woesearchaeota archaeon]|nr:hypothetical protein [Candidatus Woesearchaeota archaeon]